VASGTWEEGARAWLARRAYGGFSAWDSDEATNAVLPALLALVDYGSEALGELAAVLADKLLFTLALNSFKGVLGSARGATSAAFVTDGRMQPTSPISRLLWGMGSWNQYPEAAMAWCARSSMGRPRSWGSSPPTRRRRFGRGKGTWSPGAGRTRGDAGP